MPASFLPCLLSPQPLQLRICLGYLLLQPSSRACGIDSSPPKVPFSSLMWTLPGAFSPWEAGKLIGWFHFPWEAPLQPLCGFLSEVLECELSCRQAMSSPASLTNGPSHPAGLQDQTEGLECWSVSLLPTVKPALVYCSLNPSSVYKQLELSRFLPLGWHFLSGPPPLLLLLCFFILLRPSDV